jgi:drug/metabolite transporter (DMT)-like permease
MTGNYWLGSILVLVFVVCSALGLVVVRRFFHKGRTTKHHEVFGYFFPVAGGIYGVLLGLIVVNAMSFFDSAQSAVTDECSDLTSIYILAENQPLADKDKIRALSREYTNSVINDEWKTMADTSSPSPTSHAIAFKLLRQIINNADTRAASYSSLLDVAHSFLRHRRGRIDFASHVIPAIEWISLCVGGVLIIVFSYMFVMENLVVQMIGTILLATIIALNIYLVVAFASPFSGDLVIADEPFRQVLEFFDDIEKP